MAIYLNQINKRRAAERAARADVDEKTNERLGLIGKKRVLPQDDESALRQLLEALGIVDYELEDNDMLSPEEQLTGILRSRGIMMRDIQLRGEWWKECIGPLLGYSKDGRLVALTPRSILIEQQLRGSRLAHGIKHLLEGVAACKEQQQYGDIGLCRIFHFVAFSVQRYKFSSKSCNFAGK